MADREALLAKVRRVSENFSKKSQKTVSEWVEHEVSAGGGGCSCFGWQIEKSERPDSAVLEEAASELSLAVRKLCGLAWAALELPYPTKDFKQALEGSKPAAVAQLFCFLYAQLQCQRLSVGELTCLLDCLSPEARHEVQLGPLLRAINGRSCPAARQGGDYDTIASQPYCQICHKVGKAITRCGGCDLVAYCGPAHKAEDHERHSAWCTELLFSRVLQGVFRLADYDRLSRVPPPGHPPYKCAGLPIEDGDGGGLPAGGGWAEYFEAKRALPPPSDPSKTAARQVSCKALPLPGASTVFLSKTVPFLAVLLDSAGLRPGGRDRLAVVGADRRLRGLAVREQKVQRSNSGSFACAPMPVFPAQLVPRSRLGPPRARRLPGLLGKPKLTLWLIGADHEADQVRRSGTTQKPFGAVSHELLCLRSDCRVPVLSAVCTALARAALLAAAVQGDRAAADRPARPGLAAARPDDAVPAGRRRPAGRCVVRDCILGHQLPLCLAC
eukprot:SAG22_NODE_1473_length_4341_cov_30.519566_3_plen_499_part_00